MLYPWYCHAIRGHNYSFHAWFSADVVAFSFGNDK